MSSPPLAEDGIEAIEKWNRELHRRRIEKNEEKEEKSFEKAKSPSMFTVYVKMLSGDIISLNVNPNDNVSSLKMMIKERDDVGKGGNIIKLFTTDGEELYDKYIIKNKINDEDMIYLFVEVMGEAPFKGKKWIFFKHNENPTILAPMYWKKFHKKESPLSSIVGRRGINLKRYEGHLNEFLQLPGVMEGGIVEGVYLEPSLSATQIRHLESFRNSIKDLGVGDLLYVYAVYNIHTPNGKVLTDFIATNEDSSIVYEYSYTQSQADTRGCNNYIYINGIRLRLVSEWFNMSDEQRLRVFEM